MEAVVIVLAILFATLIFALEAMLFHRAELREAQGHWDAQWHERIMEDEHESE